MTTEEIVLYLIRTALCDEQVAEPYTDLKGAIWGQVIDVASIQGVLGICFDGVEKLSHENRPDMDNLMEWVGQISFMEQTYEEHRASIKELASFYQSVGIRVLLLKGYGLSYYWPTPNRRPVGDIDIFLFEDKPTDSNPLRTRTCVWEKADRLLTEKLGITVNNEHHHHSVFKYKGITVENHYDFINVYSHRSNKRIERMFKKMVLQGVEIEDQQIGNIFYPSKTFNALFIARHNAVHFASETMSLRQILDWALFVKKEHKNIDWEDFWLKVKEMGMIDFVSCMNDLCVNYFGIKPECFHEPDSCNSRKGLSNRMLKDIFEPLESGYEKHGIPYIWHRTLLWWANRWKHRMVYSDSIISTFCAQIVSHLMKPKTIIGV